MGNPAEEIYRDAQKQLRAALLVEGITQGAVAEIMGKTGSTLSQRLKNCGPNVFEDIANAHPPACRVAAWLFSRLAEHYQGRYDAYMAALIESAGREADDLLSGLEDGK